MKEVLDSRRIKVINNQTSDMHDDVASINESLVDRERDEALDHIDQLRTRLNIIRDQIVNGDII